MPKVFVSYRHDDSAYPAHRIYEELTSHFGAQSVIFDVDTIPLGVDFRSHLNEQVGSCDILLAIIGDRWLEILTQRRDDPKDFVRIEIQAALQRGIPVIPVLVGNASVPAERSLPADLAELAYRNAAEVRAGADLTNHVKRLVGGVERVLADQAQRAEAGRPKIETESRRPAKKADEPDQRKQRRQRAEQPAKRAAELDSREAAEEAKREPQLETPERAQADVARRKEKEEELNRLMGAFDARQARHETRATDPVRNLIQEPPPGRSFSQSSVAEPGRSYQKLVGSQLWHSIAVLVVIGLVFAMAAGVASMAGAGRAGDKAAVWVLVLFELGFPLYAFELFKSEKYVALFLGLLGLIGYGYIIFEIFSRG